MEFTASCWLSGEVRQLREVFMASWYDVVEGEVSKLSVIFMASF